MDQSPNAEELAQQRHAIHKEKELERIARNPRGTFPEQIVEGEKQNFWERGSTHVEGLTPFSNDPNYGHPLRGTKEDPSIIPEASDRMGYGINARPPMEDKSLLEKAGDTIKGAANYVGEVLDEGAKKIGLKGEND